MIANIISIVAILVSIFAIVASKQNADRQSKLQTDLTRETEFLQKRLNQDESTAAGRRFFAELWDKMKSVNHINPASPAVAVVRVNLNVMELMALCWQGNIVDRRMMELAFAKEYCNLYDEILQINDKLPDIKSQNGREILADIPSITVLYNAFKSYNVSQGKM